MMRECVEVIQGGVLDQSIPCGSAAVAVWSVSQHQHRLVLPRAGNDCHALVCACVSASGQLTCVSASGQLVPVVHGPQFGSRNASS